MSQKQSTRATKFKPELWTTVSGPGETREVWATVMLNGPDGGWPCAFGPKDKMESYAQKLTASGGELLARASPEIGRTDLVVTKTGRKEQTPAASVVLFDKEKKVLWSAP